MKVSYYPGCSLEGTAKSYDESVRKVCEALGVDLQELPAWTCCGSSPALKMNHVLSVALAAHNLALVEKQRLSDVVAPCPFCFRRLKSAQDEVNGNEKLKEKVEELVGANLNGNLTVHGLLGFLRHKVGLEAIRERVKKPLSELQVVPYYGCYAVKPPRVTGFDDPENPTSLDEILDSVGAKVLDWDFKAECCGAGLALSKTDKVVELSGRIVREASSLGADAIVVLCQLCQANLDMRQKEISRRFKGSYSIPVIYFTQLLGLAFGFSHRELGSNHHLADPVPVLAAKGFA